MLSIEIVSLTSFMQVEPVLRYLVANHPKYKARAEQKRIIALPCRQYTIGDNPAHFYKVEDIKNWLKEPQFVREMECEVTTHMVKEA